MTNNKQTLFYGIILAIAIISIVFVITNENQNKIPTETNSLEEYKNEILELLDNVQEPSEYKVYVEEKSSYVGMGGVTIIDLLVKNGEIDTYHVQYKDYQYEENAKDLRGDSESIKKVCNNEPTLSSFMPPECTWKVYTIPSTIESLKGRIQLTYFPNDPIGKKKAEYYKKVDEYSQIINSDSGNKTNRAYSQAEKDKAIADLDKLNQEFYNPEIFRYVELKSISKSNGCYIINLDVDKLTLNICLDQNKLISVEQSTSHYRGGSNSKISYS